MKISSNVVRVAKLLARLSQWGILIIYLIPLLEIETEKYMSSGLMGLLSLSSIYNEKLIQST